MRQTSRNVISRRQRRTTRFIPSRLGNKGAQRSMGRRIGIAFISLLAVGLVFIAVAGVAMAVTYNGIAANLKPRLDQIHTYTAFQASKIYDRNGTLLYEFVGEGRRTPVNLDEVSKHLINATVAAEDASFFENSGVNYFSIARATFANITQQSVGAGGASTITQQVVRLIVLTPEERQDPNVYSRKVKEIILAQELNTVYSKNEILELYLNEIPYGNLSYGVQAAAQNYFGIDAKDLDIAQASLLGGIPQLPTTYDPMPWLDDKLVLKGLKLPKDVWLDPMYDLANDVKGEIVPPKGRQIEVLRQMVRNNYVTEREARAAVATDLQFDKPEVSLLAPHFVFYVKDYLQQRYGAEVVSNGGLSITTTLDLQTQDLAQTIAYTRIQELNAADRNIHNAAVVVMQPNTGQILAMVGSIGYDLSETTTTPGEEGNVLDGKVNVTTALRQPGSALKPFTYLSGMEQYVATKGQRGITPASVLWDVPTIFNPRGVKYEPQNFDNQFHGPLRARTAVANSLNIPAVKGLKAAGIPETLNLLHRLGISPNVLANDPGYYGLALTLGGGEVTPLDLATAYNTVASGGRYFAPTPILKITDSRGKTLEEFKPTPLANPESDPVSDTSKCVIPNSEDYRLGARLPNGTQCVDGRLNHIITNMISDNEARRPIFGTNSILKLSLPAAVKTGTTNDFRDAWASGFTPFVTVTVWTGNNNNEQTAQVESTQGGGVIWARTMEAIFANDAIMNRLAGFYGGIDNMPQSFAKSYPGVYREEICEIPGPFGGRTDELFIDGLDSGGRCDLYEKISVVRLTTTDAEGKETATYCRPVAGAEYPEGAISSIYVWKLPESNDDERIDLSKWKGYTSDRNDNGEDSPVAVDPDKLPSCDAVAPTPTPGTPTPDPLTPTAPILGPGQVQMPNLVGYGENQARQILMNLGFAPDKIVVDYQGRDRLGPVFDQYPAYAVVSSLPGVGSAVDLNTVIILGIRSPDTSQPTAPPAQPTAPPAQPTPVLPVPTTIIIEPTPVVEPSPIPEQPQPTPVTTP
ncbi:transglycosylase domain-containing protein [Herpetosiphon geysericola]|uniref:transglycosylase domain-containing protein n=1 Tax=Herpetosiphon geysericola TaxID=70996 RepID=UPI0009FB039F|nr:transglycosylase domain-containing protein [Herpetosiphon geysericola]